MRRYYLLLRKVIHLEHVWKLLSNRSGIWHFLHYNMICQVRQRLFSEFIFCLTFPWQKEACTCFTNWGTGIRKKELLQKWGRKSYPQKKGDKYGIIELYTVLSTLSTNEITKSVYERKHISERMFCWMWRKYAEMPIFTVCIRLVKLFEN